MEFKLIKTQKYPYGAYKTQSGIRVSAQMKPGRDCGILLFPDQLNEPVKISFPSWSRMGRVCSMEIVLDEEQSKIFSCDDGRGVRYLLFEGENIYPDPYMKDGTGFQSFGLSSSPFSRVDTVPLHSTHNYADIPISSSFFYMLNVRGYTAHKSAKCRKAGTYDGLISKLPYISEIGVTSLILMPVYEFNEIIQTPDVAKTSDSHSPKVNFWGYSSGYYYMPKHAYAYTDDPVSEFHRLVDAIHAANMEVILQFSFPKIRGTRQITDILRFWHDRYDVDGFQLIGTGLPMDDICLDPELFDCKIIYDEPFSGESDLHNRKHIYMDQSSMAAIRKFLKGDPNSAYEAAIKLKTSDPIHNPITYVARQDSMRLLDIVSYNEKHNELNGENGRDGADYNFSWNCGFEGPCKKKNIQALRTSQVKNALGMVMLCQGAPLIYGGDEFGNSQYGNNNPYNQDNEIGYIKWPTTNVSKDILEFFKQLVKIRKEHPILGSRCLLTGRDYLSLGFPDVSLHGEELWKANLGPTSHCFGLLYYDKYADRAQDSLLYIVFNMHWEKQSIAMPKLKTGADWKIVLSDAEDLINENNKSITVPARSFVVLEGK